MTNWIGKKLCTFYQSYIREVHLLISLSEQICCGYGNIPAMKANELIKIGCSLALAALIAKRQSIL